ncbi:MAG: Hsp20/alpha crystallin family protein [Desulfobaccales bacterium]
MSKKVESPKREAEWSAGVGSMFKGLANLVEKLGDLAEKGEQLKKSGQFETKEGLRGTYGFNVRMGGLKGEEVHVEPFGNLRQDVRSGETEVQEVREPVVDLFKEQDHLLIIAEMPGIRAGDIRLEVQGDLLTMMAERDGKRYRKELLLPEPYPREKMKITCNNGILEIRCRK